MTTRELKIGSKGWCRHCGFAIVVAKVPTGRQFHPPFTRLAWVHYRPSGAMEERCMWSAEPKRHRKPADRTLYEQLADLHVRLRAAARELAPIAEEQHAAAAIAALTGTDTP